MNKQKIKEIVKFSLRRNIQNKWFVILNCLLFFIIVATINVDNIIDFLEENNINLFDDEIKIEYIDKENMLGNSLEKALEVYDNIEVEKIEENEYTAETIENNVIVEVVPSEENYLEAKIISKEGIEGYIYNTIYRVLEDKRAELFSEENSISKEKLDRLNEALQIERIMLGVDSENSEKKEMIEYVSTMVMYMVSIFIFSKIANDIAQEKVSKSIEYVLTSVTAREYLFAKIVSTVLVVLIQGMYMLVYYFIGNLINNLINMTYTTVSTTQLTSEFEMLDIELIKYVLIVFVYGMLTIILMSIIQAALSSKTTSMQESGNSMMFLLTITIAVYISTFALITPYTNMSAWIYVLSCIPLVSNFFIPAIIVIGQAKPLQLVISFLLLVISIPIAFNICSRIFKNGVLDYKPNKNKKKQPKKELSLVEEQEIKLEKNKVKKLGFIVGLSVILFMILELIASFLINMFLEPFLIRIMSEETAGLISQILVSGVGLGVASYFVHLYVKKYDKPKVLDKKNARKLFVASAFLIGALQIIIILIEVWLDIDNNVSEYLLDIDGLDNAINCILFIIEVAVMPAIFEELFFRKSMIDLSRNFGEKFAVVFSSLIFGISHLNFSQAIFAFFTGIILGTLYVKTGSMKYNCLLHFLNNGYSTVTAIMLYNGFESGLFIFTISVLVIIGLCGISAIKSFVDKLENKEKIELLEGKLIPNNFKYILADYTVIVSITFVVLLFGATETILKFIN